MDVVLNKLVISGWSRLSEEVYVLMLHHISTKQKTGNIRFKIQDFISLNVHKAAGPLYNYNILFAAHIRHLHKET